MTKSKSKPKRVSMKKSDFDDEHKRLIKTLKSPSHKDDKDEAKKQIAEVKSRKKK